MNKNFLLLAFSMLNCSLVSGQNESPFRIQFQTDTINVINDTFEVSYTLIKRLDSLSFNIDSIFYISCDEIEVMSNSLDTGNYSGSCQVIHRVFI